MYTDIKMNGEDYILIREDDVIGVMPRSSKFAAKATQQPPLGQRRIASCRA